MAKQSPPPPPQASFPSFKYRKEMEGIIPLLYKIVRRKKSYPQYKSLATGAAIFGDSERFNSHGVLTPPPEMLITLLEEPRSDGLHTAQLKKIGRLRRYTSIHEGRGQHKPSHAKGFWSFRSKSHSALSRQQVAE